MKKLLIISDSFMPRPDGVARFLEEIIPKLSEHFSITLIAPDFAGEFSEPSEYKIIRVRLSNYSINDFPIASFATTLIHHQIEKADIVWIQSLSVLGITGVRQAKKLHKPIITFNHVIEWEIVAKSLSLPSVVKWFISIVTKRVVRTLYNQCDVIMVPSVDVSYKLVEDGVIASQVLTPLGIDAEKFSPPKDKIASKVSLDIPPECFVIGFVGRLGREKDLPTLFRAFEELYQTEKNIRLLIVGKGVLQESELLIHPAVIYPGAKEQVVPYLQAMDVFVLPSLTETTSLATVEAMACGVPVITTNLPALREYIVNNENGLFFPKGNAKVLKKKIQLLLMNQTLREQLSVQGLRTVKERFSFERAVRRIKDVLDQF